MAQLPPEVQILSETFHDITGKFIAVQEQNIDLARAMGDKDSLIKEQIKLEVMKTSVGIFDHCVTRLKHQGGQLHE